MADNNRLTDWVIRKIENEYKNDIALLLAVRGHNTDADQHGLCFDYFVPATEKGYELAETFIIDGVGHDLYPRSWERLEASVEMNDMPIVLDRAEILYARSKEDEERFLDMKKRLKDNLNDFEFIYGKALEYMDKALEIYRTLIFEEKTYRVVTEAGSIQLYLSKAVAILNHTYTEEPIVSKKQALCDDPDSRIYHCPEMREVPEGFFENAEKLIRTNDPEEVKEVILKLLKATREFILKKDPAEDVQELAKESYDELAEWYQELSLTWKRIRYFAKNNMAEEAYCDAGYLQQELLYIAQEFGIEEMNLMDYYDTDDLSKLGERADELEKKVINILADHKTEVASYESLDEFLRARS